MPFKITEQVFDEAATNKARAKGQEAHDKAKEKDENAVAEPVEDVYSEQERFVDPVGDVRVQFPTASGFEWVVLDQDTSIEYVDEMPEEDEAEEAPKAVTVKASA